MAMTAAERKRRQRLRQKYADYSEAMESVSLTKEAAIILRYNSKKLECTMSEVIGAFNNLEIAEMKLQSRQRDAEGLEEPARVYCSDDLLFSALNLFYEYAATSKRSMEEWKKKAEAQALLKTYKKEEL